jgi:molecular chaperone HtpG
MAPKKNLELNATHRIVQTLKRKFEADANDRGVKDAILLMYETALLTSGFSLDAPASYGRRIFKILDMGLNGEEDIDEADADDGDGAVPPLEDVEAAAEMEKVD